LTNYRPVTNLNTTGKILERLSKNQLQEHLRLSPNLNTIQSAYQSLHSTKTAMTKVVNDLLTATDSGKPSILLSLDINAAFDMLDHTRLLQRATELFGLDDSVINWLKSYLTGRTGYVSFRNCRASIVGCHTGVPQGYVLGPLLFSIFTSPVGHLISSFSISYHHYADDTQLYTSVDPSSSTDITRLSSCAEAVTKWHFNNCLLLNPSKPEVLVTGTRPKITKFNNATADSNAFQFAGTSACRSNSVRVLALPLINILLSTIMWLK
jgi:hypothetical protein